MNILLVFNEGGDLLAKKSLSDGFDAGKGTNKNQSFNFRIVLADIRGRASTYRSSHDENIGFFKFHFINNKF